MYAISLLAIVIGLASSALAAIEPSTDELRLRRARRQLRKAGIKAPKGSEEEARALRIVLEGDCVRNA